MLRAQHKDFDEKGSSNYPRDFSRWFQLDYFQRPRALKGRRFYLTLSVTMATSLLCLATVWNARWHFVHEAAPVSKAHAGFNMNCANCHDQAWLPLARLCSNGDLSSVSNDRCSSCHDGPIHQASQASEPACASCHREHQGKPLLARVADRACASCHADLEQHTLNGKTAFHKTITSFNVDHPDFKPSNPGKQDEAKIRFTHAGHLKLDLAALRKDQPDLVAKYADKANLACADCHQVDSQRRYMKPIKYDDHCATCHRLTVTIVGDFDKDHLKRAATVFRREPAPHQEPERVRAVLRDRFVQFAQVQNLIPAEPKESRPLPWRRPTDISKGVWTWASGQTRMNEALLFANQQWKKASDQQFTQCSHCHIEAKGVPVRADGLPTYEATKIPPRWYTHSVFNHGSHRMMDCGQCHDKAMTSQTTADILLPKLQLCQQCHKPGGLARNDCVECHQYHDHQLERGVKDPFTVEEMLRKH